MIYFNSFMLLFIAFNQLVIILKLGDMSEEQDFQRLDLRYIRNKINGGFRWKK